MATTNTSILRSEFKTYLAQNLVDKFKVDSDDRLFVYTAGVTLSSDETTTLNTSSDLQARLSLRKATGFRLIDNVSAYLMITKNAWVNNTKYDEYDDTVDLSTKTFYVTNTEGNVYKCLSNGQGSNSIDEPTGISFEPIKLRNDYIWKYMFTIPAAAKEFATSTEIPVLEIPIYPNRSNVYGDERELQYDAQKAAKDGAIESVIVVSAGSAYANAVRAEKGQNIRALSTGQYPATTQVRLAAVASSTDDAYNNYAIRIVAGTGVGQIRTITDYNGAQRLATISVAWTITPDTTSVYEIAPSVTFSGDGAGAAGFARMNSNLTLDEIVMSDTGSGYSEASIALGGSVSTAPVVRPVIGPIGGHSSAIPYELLASKVLVVARVERDGDAFPGDNDIRMYGFVLNPEIGSGHLSAGTVAGAEGTKTTLVDIEANIADRALLRTNDFPVGTYVFANDPPAAGRVTRFTLEPSGQKAELQVENLSGNLPVGTIIRGLTGTATASTSGWQIDGSFAKVVQTLESEYGTQQKSYRASTLIEAVRADGANLAAGLFVKDANVTGASGGGAVLIEAEVSGSGFSGGKTATFFVNDIKQGGNTLNEYGFTASETLQVRTSGGNVDFTIAGVTGPEIKVPSGKVLYIRSIDPLARNDEQYENYQLEIDF